MEALNELISNIDCLAVWFKQLDEKGGLVSPSNHQLAVGTR